MHAYRRLAAELTRELTDGLWRNGEALPSENALAQAYSVSRRTVRQALDQLRGQGLVSKGQGRSTVYLERALGRSGERLVDFPTAARAAGLKPSTRLLWTRRRIASLGEAHALKIALGTEVMEICRVRMLDGRPVVRQASLLPLAVADRLPMEKLTGASLYGLLRNGLQDEILLSLEHVSLLRASGDEAEALAVPEGAALLRVQRVVTDARGMPVEYSNSALEASFFRF